MDTSGKAKYFPLGIGIAAGILAAASAALFLALKGQVFWGLLLYFIVLIPGLSALLLFIRGLREGQNEAASPVTWTDLNALLDTLKTHFSQSEELKETLHTEISERDAIINHINAVLDGITAQFNEIELSANQGMDALGVIERDLNSLNAATANQSSGFEEAGTRMSGIGDLIGSLSGRIRDSSARASSLLKTIAAGEDHARTVNEVIKQISQGVETITGLTTTINQISEQTNILSMNAAIESAHAGSAGAGFAVVADEIKKLAESTRENAGDIQEALRAIVHKTAEARKASDLSEQNFKGITEAVRGFNQELSGITGTAAESNSMSREVEASLGEQKALTRTIRDGSADIIVHNNSFRAALELIQNLTDKTRAEIKEIRSGTQEVLEHIQKTERNLLENLRQTEAIHAAFQAALKSR